MITSVFWDTKEILLTDYLVKGKTITGVYFTSFLAKLKAATVMKHLEIATKRCCSQYISQKFTENHIELLLQLPIHPMSLPRNSKLSGLDKNLCVMKKSSRQSMTISRALKKTTSGAGSGNIGSSMLNFEGILPKNKVRQNTDWCLSYRTELLVEPPLYVINFDILIFILILLVFLIFRNLFFSKIYLMIKKCILIYRSGGEE